MSAPDEVRFSALGCGFRVAADDPEVAAHVRCVFRHLPPGRPEGPDRVYVLARRGDGGVDLGADGEVVGGDPPIGPLRALVRDVDEHLIAHSPRLLVHASAAVHGSVGLAFPARSGSGKSTLVAGLVRAGFAYLTDELVSPGWDTGEVAAYPRAVALLDGARGPLAELEPQVAPALRPLLGGQWQVDPEDIRPGAVAGPCHLGFVVFPSYAPSAPTTLERLGRPRALLDLVECTFHFHRHGARALEVLAGVVGGCECYRLTIGNLDEACALVGRLVGAGNPSGAA